LLRAAEPRPGLLPGRLVRHQISQLSWCSTSIADVVMPLRQQDDGPRLEAHLWLSPLYASWTAPRLFGRSLAGCCGRQCRLHTAADHIAVLGHGDRELAPEARPVLKAGPGCWPGGLCRCYARLLLLLPAESVGTSFGFPVNGDVRLAISLVGHMGASHRGRRLRKRAELTRMLDLSAWPAASGHLPARTGAPDAFEPKTVGVTPLL